MGSTGIQYTYDVKFSVFDHDPDGTLVNADGVTIGLCLDGLADGVHKLVRHVRHLVDHLAADVDADRQNR